MQSEFKKTFKQHIDALTTELLKLGKQRQVQGAEWDIEQNKADYEFYFNAGWAAAKAQAVPEGFVVVPKVPTQKMLDATINVPIPAVYVDSISGQHKLKVAAYYKAMIEAQEQANG